MTDSNSFLAPLQSEIAELRKRCTVIEEALGRITAREWCNQPSQSQPDEPQGVETAEAFYKRVRNIDVPLLPALREWEAAIRADERRKYSPHVLERYHDGLRAKLEAAERDCRLAKSDLASAEQDLVKWKARNEREGHEWKRLLEKAERERDEWRRLHTATLSQRDELKALCDKLARRADAAEADLARARAVVEASRVIVREAPEETSADLWELDVALRAFDAKGEK